ncbi:MAG: hypothetical protein LBU16_09775 [Treponema sp.]|jgi:hypothetical protein|nr:hypothetical protein [Treponema sp.]
MLIVETGSGIVGADAYVDIPYVSAYLVGEQQKAWEMLDEPEQEAAIIRATRAVDVLYDWLGSRKTLDQGLSWPRFRVMFEGFKIEGVPAAVQKAAAEAVGLVLEGEEFFSNEADMEVASERVDVIAVTYRVRQAGEKKEATKFEALNRLVRGLCRTESRSGVGAARVERV